MYNFNKKTTNSMLQYAATTRGLCRCRRWRKSGRHGGILLLCIVDPRFTLHFVSWSDFKYGGIESI